MMSLLLGIFVSSFRHWLFLPRVYYIYNTYLFDCSNLTVYWGKTELVEWALKRNFDPNHDYTWFMSCGRPLSCAGKKLIYNVFAILILNMYLICIRTSNIIVGSLP